ncbi:MAG: LamG domain-containing protein [Planctomycetaceae bacterium]|nr:LamG domain-containing protein [Planctomycetaceae bacterium]
MKSQYTLRFTLVLLLGAAVAADSVVKTVYVDGAYVGQATVPAALVHAYNHLLIGAEGNVGYRYNEYRGKIDEFAIYKGLLSSARIAAHYNALTSGYVAEVTADRPLLYLRFEDPNSLDGSPAVNSGSVNIDGIYMEDIILSAGYVGNAAEFSYDGEEPDSAGDCIDVPDLDGDFSLLDVTIELWMQSSADPNNYPRLFQHNGSYTALNSYGLLMPDANSIAVTGGGATSYFDDASAVWLADGNWHHVVLTFNSTVDDITFKPYPEEVMDDDPVLYLRFEETTPVDSSVNNYWVAYNTDVELRDFETAWGIGNSMFIPNTAANAVAAGPAATMPSDLTLTGNQYAFADGDITFEMWVNSTGMDSYATIFQQGRSEEVAPGIGNSGGSLRILCGDDGNAGNGQNWSYTGAATPLDGKWHQIVVVYDEIDPNQMTIELYKDGAHVETKSITSTTANAKLGPELNHLVIGGMGTCTSTNAGNRFSGLIDEFSVYAGILPAERIAVHYAAGLAAMVPKTCVQLLFKGGGLKADIDKDCDVDFADFAAVASTWMLCNDPALFATDPDCKANW